jgi:SNF2 family DNA or RNA helicase
MPEVHHYVLPNRRAFADFVTRSFLKHQQLLAVDVFDQGDPCTSRSSAGSGGVMQLLPYQELVRDYLLNETPYRGLLLSHGLGSGKTFTSIAVALSVLETRPIYVMLPASLRGNYEKELFKVGLPLYAHSNHWTYFSYGNDPDLQRQAQDILKVSPEFLQNRQGIWLVDSSKPENFDELTPGQRDAIREQVESVLKQRFKFINYKTEMI